MQTDPKGFRSIRNFCDEQSIDRRGKVHQPRRDAALERLHRAFWGNRLERDGRACLGIDLAQDGRRGVCTRELMYRLFPKPGMGPRVPDLWACKSEDERYAAIANMRIRDFEGVKWWFYKFFENVLIPEHVLRCWWERSDPDDGTGRRIVRVLEGAALKKEANSHLSDSDVARHLAPDEQKFEGFRADAIRKIVGGNYGPARNRELPGLRDWMRLHRS